MMMEEDDSNTMRQDDWPIILLSYRKTSETMRQDDTSQDKNIVLLSIVRKDKLLEILIVLSLRLTRSLWRKQNWWRKG